jgi:hypothetical protein
MQKPIIRDLTASTNPMLQPGTPKPISVAVTPPTDLDVGLIGLLRGDVDGSWDPNRFGVGGE